MIRSIEKHDDGKLIIDQSQNQVDKAIKSINPREIDYSDIEYTDQQKVVIL